MRAACAVVGVLVSMLGAVSAGAQSGAGDDATAGPRLYVLDGGVLRSELDRYGLDAADVEEVALSVASYLIVHPRGVLLWDAGAIADVERVADGTGVEQRVVRRDGDERFVTLAPPLRDQLAAIGYAPGDVTHLALSHYHWDHTADASTFADATWLVTEAERDAMFAADPPGGTRPRTYAALRESRTVIIDEDEHDVFGDGTVIIRQSPGHTEGHLVLYVALERTGAVVLSGDLYHYPAERRLHRVPSFEVSREQTAASREDVERFLEGTGAELWIQHDLVHHRTLRLAPAYYD